MSGVLRGSSIPRVFIFPKGMLPGMEPEPAREELRVVVCDDDPDLRLMLRVLLADDPRIHVVGEAASGDEAVRLVREQEPDVVVLDIVMPGMDGYEALPLIRAASPRSKVVVFTGYERPQLEEVAAVTSDAFVQKGGPSDQIVHVIRATGLAGAAA